jgi:predicted O-methyltransferase YrrM
MKQNDMLMFYRYLAKSTSYFEYGSGGSTYQAAARENNQRIVSVESDFEWHTKLKSIVKNPVVQFIYCDINTSGEYSDAICRHGNKELNLILIDGRFRVACCLKCFDVISDACVIAFDDFLDNPKYHIVLNFYDIIERTKDNRMAILRKKSVTGPLTELVEAYEVIID